MKRALAIIALTAATIVAGRAVAQEAKSEKAAATPKVQSWTGEVVDMGCYVGHGAKGEKHKDCGTKCVANGMPMGLLTKEGKLYLLTMNHDSPDPYNQCKDWVSQTVEVSGTMATRAGVSAIDVQGAKPAAATK
jgi:hypothetical protein